MDLRPYAHLPIDWNLSPEDAVTLYLEWGNNNWHAEHAPVRSKSDVAIYFVVDTWESPALVRLVRRNSEAAEDLVSFPLPESLAVDFHKEFGDLKAIFEPTPAIKAWLKHALYGEEKNV